LSEMPWHMRPEDLKCKMNDYQIAVSGLPVTGLSSIMHFPTREKKRASLLWANSPVCWHHALLSSQVLLPEWLYRLPFRYSQFYVDYH
jgi:hypothetical protein